ncbi:MAG: peptidylprolyl isomerase [Rhodovarius sp.]|nr:peptidylprolyl isomerase [Rhodovarius sp.]
MFRAALLALALLAGPAPAQPAPAAPPQGQGLPGANRILAVVNGDVVTLAEVESRARLFALSAGLPPSPEAMRRLEPQIIRLLIDEKLRIQEVQRRRIPVTDNDVAEALAEIERRNNLPRGALVAQLRSAGVQPRALFDQIRAQIGWSRLLRSVLGQQAQISEAEVADYLAAQRARQGQVEYLLGEIFIPVEDPATEAEVRRFVEEVTEQLRRGLPFTIAATQFSQSQTALQGGDLGWQTADRLDPVVAGLVQRMPPGAISNPIRVPGGYQIITLRARRDAGGGGQGAAATVLSVRQLFLPFPGRLDPANPTEAQRAVVERAQRLSQTARGCEAIEQAARGVASDRPLDPGPVVLETLQPPALRALLARLPVGRASEPLIAPDGVALFMVCARERREPEGLSAEQVREILLRERIENISRQLQRELRRRAVIDTRA